MTGEVVACDVLPLRGDSMRGPWAYHLLSTYRSALRGRDALKWHLKDVRGAPHHAPTRCAPICHFLASY